MELNGRVALITGAKRIGVVVAEELARRGVDVALAYAGRARKPRRPRCACGRMGGARQSFRPIWRSPTRAARWSRARRKHSAASTSSSTWRRSTSSGRSTNSNRPTGTQPLTWISAPRSCARRPPRRTCAQQGGGRIINFSDWVARSGRPRYLGYLPYYVAKAGVIALTEALALELAPDNILVNAIAPGPILAPPETTDAEMQAVEQSTPLGRWGGEIEIAKAVLGLLEQRLHHRRNHEGRRRPAREVTQRSTH